VAAAAAAATTTAATAAVGADRPVAARLGLALRLLAARFPMDRALALPLRTAAAGGPRLARNLVGGALASELGLRSVLAALLATLTLSAAAETVLHQKELVFSTLVGRVELEVGALARGAPPALRLLVRPPAQRWTIIRLALILDAVLALLLLGQRGLIRPHVRDGDATPDLPQILESIGCCLRHRLGVIVVPDEQPIDFDAVQLASSAVFLASLWLGFRSDDRSCL